MTVLRIALFASLLTLTVSTTFADTIRVGPSRAYTTIQDGVDNALAGDTILIDEGVYVETVSVSKSDLTIRPAKKGKKGKVTISGGGADTSLAIGLGGNNCTVKDLYVTDSLDYGISFGLNTGVRLIRCTVSGGAAIAGISSAFSSGAEVRKCNVIGVTGDGIVFAAASYFSISKCKVKDAAGSGIWIFTPGGSVTDNKIVRSDDVGIELGDPANMIACIGALISGNEIKDAGLDGIRASSYASQCVIEDNEISSCWSGVEVYGSNHLVAENVDGNCSFDAFSADDSATGVVFYKNVSKDAGFDGFETAVGTSNCDFVKNKSRRAGFDGFDVQGDGHTYTNNDSQKSGALDFDTATGTNCVYSGNVYDTSDF